MKRTLLVLAFVAAAEPASAQMAHAPADDNAKTDTRMNIMNRAGGSVGPHGASTSAAAATAKKRIEMDGYEDVHDLAKGADGLWRGTARRGSEAVEVTVDRAGRVTEQ